MDFDTYNKLALPILGITLIDINDVEIKLFSLVYEKDYTEEYDVLVKIAEILIYSGPITNIHHFQRIMHFIDQWNEMVAKYLLSRKLQKDCKDQLDNLRHSTSVCIVANPSLKDIPLSPNHAETMGFPLCLNQDPSFRVFKCFDYRHGDRRKLPLLGDRRAHDYFLKFLDGTVIEYQQTGVIKDESLVVISYPYLPGNHVPMYAWQLQQILELLLTMHGEGIVHGDVRLRNMIFSVPSVATDFAVNASTHTNVTPRSSFKTHYGTAHIIDFDLSGLINQRRYPSRYAIKLSDTKRHEEAIPLSLLKPCHDLYALAHIWEMFELDDPHSNEGDGEQWKEAIKSLQILVLKDIADLKQFRRSVEMLFSNFLSRKIKLTDRKLFDELSPNIDALN
jgi:hypothetical protein